MNCEVCGTELPYGAMFCGECGHAVGVRTGTAMHPDSGMPFERPQGHAASAGSRDTLIIEAGLDGLPEFESEILPGFSAGSLLGAGPLPAVEQDLAPDLVEEDAVEEAAVGDAPIEEAPGGETAVEEDPTPREDPAVRDVPAIPAQPVADLASRWAPPGIRSAPAVEARPDPFPWGDREPASFLDSDELEQTVIVPRREGGQRFVLQFSTGESVTVFGGGLLGRNPTPQPSEYFDHLVSISDPGKSVSKTHLEFGQEAGSFWVSDRFSGNGSVVREPEATPRRLVPGKRYRIVRGTRVDIGEQFFVVSCRPGD